MSTYATSKRDVTISLHMTEEVAARLAAFLVNAVDWGDQSWAKDAYEALVEQRVTRSEEIDEAVIRSIRRQVLGSIDTGRITDDDYLVMRPDIRP